MQRIIESPYFTRGDLISWEEFDIDSFASCKRIGILLRVYEDLEYETHAVEVLVESGNIVYKVLPLDDLEILSPIVIL